MDLEDFADCLVANEIQVRKLPRATTLTPFSSCLLIGRHLITLLGACFVSQCARIRNLARMEIDMDRL